MLKLKSVANLVAVGLLLAGANASANPSATVNVGGASYNVTYTYDYFPNLSTSNYNFCASENKKD